jgi:hypothetical protein
MLTYASMALAGAMESGLQGMTSQRMPALARIVSDGPINE